MTDRTVETSRQFYARLAGFTILFYIAVGLTSVVLYSLATSAEGIVRSVRPLSPYRDELQVIVEVDAFLIAVSSVGEAKLEIIG